MEQSEQRREAEIVKGLQLVSSPSSNTITNPSRLLSSARSLLLSPSPPSSTTLHRLLSSLSLLLLSPSPSHTHLHHSLHLLTDLALLHPSLSSPVFSSLRSYLRRPSPLPHRLSLHALSSLLALSPSPLSPADAHLLASLLSSPTSSVRLRALRLLLLHPDAVAVEGGQLRAILRFMKDPCPLTRRAALDGFVQSARASGSHETDLLDKCYRRAVELLLDRDGDVRVGAVRAVCEWGQILMDAEGDLDDKQQLDQIFIELCSMARDMDVNVRVEAFIALGKTRLVSEVLLLQTLSKKVLAVNNERATLGKYIGEEIAFSVSSAAGAYVHGFEDEFFEVRKAACSSLGSLTALSFQFAGDALNLLIDVLNDDTLVVRLETLHLMFQMATVNRLKVHEQQLDMFLGVLGDVDPVIRTAARNLLRVIMLPDLEMFKSSITALINNLETYPEDEVDIFPVLFHIGKNHGGFTISSIKEVAHEMKPSHEGELALDRPRTTAFMILTLSAAISNEHLVCDIPAELFSYVTPLLGRISCHTSNAISKDMLLAYLCHCTGGAPVPGATPIARDAQLLLYGIEESNLSQIMKSTLPMGGSLQKISDGTTEGLVAASVDDKEAGVALKHGELIHAIELILRAASDTWPLMKLGLTKEVHRTLRACKRELDVLPGHSHRCNGILAFASHYLKLIKLLMRVWEHLQPRKVHSTGVSVLDILLEKLEVRLRSMRYGFVGFSKEEESYVLELVLFMCVLRFFGVRKFFGPTLSKLQETLSRLDVLCGEGSVELSDFAKELKKCCQEKTGEVSYPLAVDKLVDIFSLKHIVFSGGFKHKKADIDVLGNDSENPLLFIPGLPVGITFQISLYNVSSKDRVWLQVEMDDSLQHVFLDLNQFEGSDKVKKCTIEIPFYRTPRAISFLLRGCVGIECQLENMNYQSKGQGGPWHELIFLCKEKVIYLAIVDNNY